MEELAGLLSRERLLLELLLFKLTTLRQLLLSGEVRFLGWAAEEVERATAKVRAAELSRAVAVAGVAQSTGRDQDELTLRSLAETAPEPWRTIFADHRRGFLRLAGEVEEALSATRRLATTGSAAVSAVLDRLTGEQPETVGAAAGAAASTYGPEARWQAASSGPRVSRTL